MAAETKAVKAKLTDLPFRPGSGVTYAGGDGIKELYLAELKAVRTARQLVAHVKRWRVLWLLDAGRFPPPLVDVQPLLASGRFKTKGLIKKMRQLRKKHWHGHATARVTWLAADILIPAPLLRATLVAHKYGCPSNGALIQIYDGQDYF